jgi:putative phosphoribosyl transferase
MIPFRSRREAGERLAARLASLGLRDAVVLALPRGGLPLAVEVAARLRAPLDVLAVKKIGAPGHAELALGAVGEDGVPWWNEELTYEFPRDFLDQRARDKLREVRRQLSAYRRVRAAVPLAAKVVVLVDDGLATGATMEAAVRLLRARNAGRIVVAVPVASPEAAARIRAVADELVALAEPEAFYAVGQFYEDFSQVSDEEALEIFGGAGGAGSGSEQ